MNAERCRNVMYHCTDCCAAASADNDDDVEADDDDDDDDDDADDLLFIDVIIRVSAASAGCNAALSFIDSLVESLF